MNQRGNREIRLPLLERRDGIMPYDMTDKLKIAVGSRALFQLEKENEIFEREGIAAYERYQREHETDILLPGAGFRLVRALLQLNDTAHAVQPVEILIASRNSADTGSRVFRSLERYGLDITRGLFTSGAGLAPYLKAFDIDLFLTANPADAQAAIDCGIPAATIVTDHAERYDAGEEIHEIRIAFDGDAVLFSDEAEAVFKRDGLEAFSERERDLADQPLPEGPFAKFLRALNRIQKEGGTGPVTIRTALVTSRNAPAHQRVISTLRAWDVRVDESFFLGGLPKTEILRAFGAHIFFDDQRIYTEAAANAVPSAKVPYGPGSVFRLSAREEGN